MSSPSPRSVFEAYLKAANGRDIAALEGLLHPDFEDRYSQSGEVTNGYANLRAIIEHYPGGYDGQGIGRVVGGEDRWVPTPMFTLLRIEGTGNVFTDVSRGRYPDGSEWFIVTIAEIRDDRVWRAENYFAQTFEPPAWRSSWVETKPT